MKLISYYLRLARFAHARTTWVLRHACCGNASRNISDAIAVYLQYNTFRAVSRLQMAAQQQRKLSFSIERILHQPFESSVAILGRSDGSDLPYSSFAPASLPGSPRSHPAYAYSLVATAPLVAQMLQQRAAMIAAPTGLWAYTTQLGANNGAISDNESPVIFGRGEMLPQAKNSSECSH